MNEPNKQDIHAKTRYLRKAETRKRLKPIETYATIMEWIKETILEF